MKKVLSALLAGVLSLGLIACGGDTTTPTDTKIEDTKQEEKEDKKKNNKEEKKLKEGQVFESINKITNVGGVSEITDTEIGYTNLNITLKINKGTAIEELKSFIDQAAKIQTNLKSIFLEKNYQNISYYFTIEGEFKATLVTYKKQNNDYKLNETLVIEENYKEALKHMN